MAKLERRPAERVAVAGVIVQVLSAVLAYVFYRLSQAASAWVLTWQSLIGVVIWVTCLMHLRQSRLADEEQEEWERLQAERAAGGARGQLFEADEIQAFAARNRLRILERYVAPVISVFVALLLVLVAVVGLWPSTVAGKLITRIGLFQIDQSRALISVAFLVAMTFMLFLIAMYASGMSRQRLWRPLRSGASYMMFSTLLGAATAGALALGQFGFMLPDVVIAHVMLVLMSIVAIEVILNFVLDFYRPRVEGVEARAAYDSRLLDLIAQPGGILKTVAATLDYQFGFRVSQTWFYRFIEQAIAPLILFQILTLYGLTCFVIVGADQQGILERFGKFKSPLLPAGLHMKWPWPIERVHRFSANQVKTLYLGHSGEMIAEKEILWTNKHYEKEYNVMVPTLEEKAGRHEVPVNLLVASMTIRYQITGLENWHYGFCDREILLESLCNREQSKYLASADFFDVMGVGRARVAEDLRRAIQQAVDDVEGAGYKGLGVTILGVGLEGIHPPIEEGLPEAFHGLVKAIEQRETDMLDAQRTVIGIEAQTKADAEADKLEAESYYAERVALEEAEAQRFEMQNKAYRNAEGVFKAREFLSALEVALTAPEKGKADPRRPGQKEPQTGPRKYVIGVSGLRREHIRLNLEDPFGPDIGDIGAFDEPVMPEENPIR